MKGAICAAGGLLLWLAAFAGAEEGIPLRYRLRPGDRFAYARTATVAGALQLRSPGPDGAVKTLQVRATIRALSTQQVDGRLPDGSYRVLERHILAVEVNGQPLPIPVIGPIETRLSPLGVRQQTGSSALSDLLPFGLGLPDLLPGAVLHFPPDPVRIGSRWQTRAEWMLPGQQEAAATTTSQFAAIEDALGQRCARIASDVAIPDFALAAPSEAGGGLLRVRGMGNAVALHSLQTGVPVQSRIQVRLWVKAEGAVIGGETPPKGTGELTILIEGQQVSPETRAPAPPPRPRVRPPSAARRPAPATVPRGLRIRRPAAGQQVGREMAVECEVGIPEARYALLRVDGAARAAINAPYRYRLDLDNLSVGAHVLEVTIYAEGGVALATARQSFRVAKPRPGG